MKAKTKTKTKTKATAVPVIVCANNAVFFGWTANYSGDSILCCRRRRRGP